MRSSLNFTKQSINFLLIACGLFSSCYSLADNKELSPAEETLKTMEKCRQEKSSLERLDCYDNALGRNISGSQEKNRGGAAWNRAVEQENTRINNSISLLMKSYNMDGNNPVIIITTPALGHKSPRPVLMFSCIDNITRLQIALFNSSEKRDTYVQVSTDRTKFETRWFFRENGFLLEASRGLEGISEIQRLFKSNVLKLISDISAINGLTFNIQNLEQEIKPLRTACHW